MLSRRTTKEIWRWAAQGDVVEQVVKLRLVLCSRFELRVDARESSNDPRQSFLASPKSGSRTCESCFPLQAGIIISQLDQTCLSESTHNPGLLTKSLSLTPSQDPSVVVLRQVQSAHRRPLPCSPAVHCQECPDRSGHLWFRYWCLFVTSISSRLVYPARLIYYPRLLYHPRCRTG